jgi:SAM-dependent methyltransferase
MVWSLNRVVMNRTSKEWISALGPAKLEAAEISGDWGKLFKFKTFESFHFPKHDICQGPFADDQGKIRKFDFILANQVWEHLDRPAASVTHVYKMLRNEGWFWIAVPFFIPFHAAPNDCTRWTARGLRNLLIEGGFDPGSIKSQEWGNRAAALRNMEIPWPPEYLPDSDDLTNDPAFPIVAWAMGQKRKT